MVKLKNIKQLLFVALVVLALCSCKEQVIHNLTENEVNKFLTRLHDEKIEGDKVKQPDGRWGLAVDKADAVRAIKILEESRLLRTSDASAREKPSMISSREDQRFRHERALSREIENTIASIAGVLEARVHLNMAPTDPLFGTPIKHGKSSASVLVVAQEQFSLSEDDLAGLVAGASGIDRESISVLINKTSTPQRAAAGASSLTKEVVGADTATEPTDAAVSEAKIAPEFLAAAESPSVELAASNEGLIWQIIASLVILIGGGVWLFVSKRKARKPSILDTPLLKVDDK